MPGDVRIIVIAKYQGTMKFFHLPSKASSSLRKSLVNRASSSARSIADGSEYRSGVKTPGFPAGHSSSGIAPKRESPFPCNQERQDIVMTADVKGNDLMFTAACG